MKTISRTDVSNDLALLPCKMENVNTDFNPNVVKSQKLNLLHTSNSWHPYPWREVDIWDFLGVILMVVWLYHSHLFSLQKRYCRFCCKKNQSISKFKLSKWFPFKRSIVCQVDSGFTNGNHNLINDDGFANGLDSYIMMLNGAVQWSNCLSVKHTAKKLWENFQNNRPVYRKIYLQIKGFYFLFQS